MAQELDVTAPLSSESRIVAAPDLLASDLAGEMVVLNLADGVYYGLDAVGAHVWRLLGVPRTVRALVDEIVSQFDVDRERCHADLLSFLADLNAHGLVIAAAPEAR
ncbi:MAG: PqqD family protein [Gemmatimonadota bacterium]|nr:PqqD family protein [Gemmatimonadota bacterium]